MKQIALEAIANQSFSIRLDNRRYDIIIKETNGVMSVSIARDNVQIVQGARIVAGFPLINYQYQESGNFIFLTENEELPDYTKFKSTQTLLYASAAELAVING